MDNFTGSLWLKFTLLSDATFGRGDGLAGLVDAEIQHDEYGLPYMSGKTLKGLLASECAEILWALKQSGNKHLDQWYQAARFLFGNPGSQLSDTGQMIVGNAQLPDDLQAVIWNEFRSVILSAGNDQKKLEREKGKKQRANLESLTALRRQTAIDMTTGASKDNSLRTMRIIIRGITFTAQLDFNQPVPEKACWLLAACVHAFHRAGTGRNRGRGRIQATLSCDLATVNPNNWFSQFVQEIRL